jgi:hypothetical protein
VQDRYAADVGDFLKLGLLRYLTSTHGYLPSLRLGVVWYRVIDEVHNADGKHVAYLSHSSLVGRSLRRLDAGLYDRLAGVIDSGTRSVAALEEAGVLPEESASFNEALTLGHLPPTARVQRVAARKEWLARALVATDRCDLVFVDPDNGVRRSDHGVPSHRNKTEKHAYFDELREFSARGQSLVAYHHADRSTTVDRQAHLRLADAAEQLSIEPLAAVRASRGTNRLFLVLPAARHRSNLEMRLRDLEKSSWSSELKVYWWAPDSQVSVSPVAELN